MPVYDVNQIKELIPHRFPFLLVDRIITLEENRCVGLKNFTANESFSQEYFGGIYLMQGILQIEAMAQVAAVMIASSGRHIGQLAYFSTFERIRFRRPVVPGDQLILDVTMERARTRAYRFRGRCLVDGEVACEARFACMLAPTEAVEDKGGDNVSSTD